MTRAGPGATFSSDLAPRQRTLYDPGSDRRPRAQLLPFGVRQPIPSFELPLLRGDDEPSVELGALLHALYERAGYDLRIDYRADAEPPLAAEDAAWADELLRGAGLR
ncbi:MAG TPA: DUF4058 family protein [Chloroflexaceae bacterium]|nr:DUF4058 family protein [Chloroflexaceae bacterium]